MLIKTKEKNISMVTMTKQTEDESVHQKNEQGEMRVALCLFTAESSKHRPLTLILF